MSDEVILPDDKFDYEKIIDIILKIESNVDVNNYKFEEIILWPLLRQQLWTNLQSKKTLDNTFSLSVDLSDGEQASKRKYKPIYKRVIKKLKSIFSLNYYNKLFVYCNRLLDFSNRTFLQFKSYRRCICEVKKFATVISTNKLKRKAVLLHSKPAYYQMNTSKGTVNVHIDPIFDIYSNENVPVYKFMTKQYSHPDKPMLSSIYLNIDIFKHHYANYHDVRNSRRARERKRLLTSELVSLKAKVDKVLNSSELYINYNRLVEEILMYSWCFNILLKNFRDTVSCLYTNCYYDVESMMLINMAKKYKIATIDMQHGKQGTPHGMYTHWKNLPSAGYSSLPDIFFNWGVESSEAINKWIPEFCKSKHQAVTVGSPRIGFFKQGLYKSKLSDIEKSFLSRLETYDQVILFTVQPQNDIPDIVIESIRKLKTCYILLVRMHPNMRDDERRIIGDKIGNCNLGAFEITNSTTIDLYTLLDKVDIHITKWSSVCFEASIFNVPTIIVGSIGKKMYRKQIADSQFMYSDSSGDLVKNLSFPKRLDNNYILSDLDLFRSAAMKIYNHEY